MYMCVYIEGPGVCIYEFVSACIYKDLVCVYICLYARVYKDLEVIGEGIHIQIIYIYTYVRTWCVRIYVCMCVYI